MLDMESEKQLPIVEIPKNSFTAFRLAYCTPQYISDTSKCTLLGKVPAMWLSDDSSGLISSVTQHAKLKMRKKFRPVRHVVNSSVQAGMGTSPIDDEDTVEAPHYNENVLRLFKKLVNEKRQDQIFENRVSNEAHSSDIGGSLSREIDSVDSLPTTSSQSETSFAVTSEERSNTQVANNSSDGHPPQLFDDEERTLSNELYNHIKRPSMTTNIEIDGNQDHDRLSYHMVESGTDGDVRLEPEVFQQKSSKIENIESEHRKFRHRLKQFVNAYRGKAKMKSYDVRSRFLAALLNRYKPGEIFKISKMLVLTKQAYSTSDCRNFDENEILDSRVYDRWKEYLVVIRKTADLANPLEIQFFDCSGTKEVDIDGEPETCFRMDKSVNAQFYSSFDKSICLTVPRKNGTRIYILQCSNQKTALRWLVFFKQVLGHDMDSLFNVNVPEISVTLVVKVPEKVVLESFDEEPDLQIKIQESGYEVRHSLVIQYLKDRLLEVFTQRMPEKAASLIANKQRLWFCFKYYDRLEWIYDDSILFHAQNELLKKTYKLELRVMNYYPRLLEIEDKTRLVEPYPFEGFLLRLTKASAKFSSMVHPIHKALYAYTSENLIFFTKYYRGEPPAPDKKPQGQHRTDMWAKMPRNYEHVPYPIDDHNHITWLESDDFYERDLAASEEMERRSMQVVKAESLIDVCEIKEVRELHRGDLFYSQCVFHDIFWYSSTAADDDYLVDSAFEIVMKNDSVIRFHASDKDTRNEWVERIVALKNYWVERKRIDLARIMHIRAHNQKNLKVNEYVDSNIVSESTPIETYQSVADPYIHTIDSISMPKCVLMSGFLYQKHKKHSNFNQYYVVLCPGFIILFSVCKRSRKTGLRRKQTAFQHYLTIPIAYCYLYSGYTTVYDLLDRQRDMDPMNPCRRSLPRIYPDGWKSSEEEHTRCFTLWFGKKREIIKHDKHFKRDSQEDHRNTVSRNPGYVKLISKLGVTGKSMVFMARSRQEREIWAYKINSEIEKNAK